ncbi:MAG: family 43 glycosylhydrolase [Bacteroidota bacterium]
MHSFIKVVWVTFFLVSSQAFAQTTFTNPIGGYEADPWVIYKDGYYYYCATSGDKVVIHQSAKLHEVAKAPGKTVWIADNSQEIKNAIWAPEIHYLNGKWYIYASGRPCDYASQCTHQSFVLEGTTQNPLDPFVFKSILAEGIDGTVLQKEGTAYFSWMRSEKGITHHISLARMLSPTQLDTAVITISQHPFLEWETRDQYCNEGPAFLQRGNKTFIVYSASASWTKWYCLGAFVNEDGDFMNPSSWKKLPQPLFVKSDENGVYGPGHCSFTQSPDGTEDWILYHALADPNGGWGGRTPRIQKINWSADNLPIMGEPYGSGIPLPVPSDKTCSPQTITFEKILPHRITDPDFKLNANSDASLPIAFSITGPAQLVKGQVHLTGKQGKVTIIASQAGNTQVCAAWPQSRHFNVINPKLKAGKGKGLKATYYNGQNFESPVLERIDSTISLDWQGNSPSKDIHPDHFSARWEGLIESKFTEEYTFSIVSDNGRRLWIDNKLIVDKWLDDFNKEYNGSISLQAGKKYSIRLEYFEKDGGANIQLFWKSDQQPKEIVPRSQLYTTKSN